MPHPSTPARIRFRGARVFAPGGVPVRIYVLGMLLLGGCGSSTAPVREPVSITVTPGSLVFDALQDTQSLEARVVAEDGTEMTDVPVTWTSLNPAVVEVSPAGEVRSLGNGETSVRATAGSATRTVAVSVTQMPANLEIVDGNEQDAPPGTVLPLPLRIRITDRLGNPIRRVIVFSVSEGGGSVSPGSVTSGSDGSAQAVWTLGTSTGPQTVLVTVPGASQLSVLFRTAGTPPPPPPGGFSIEFDFAPSVSPAVRQAFETAAERWREIIAEKVPSVFLTVPPNSCGPNPQLLSRSFDDLFVFVTVEPFAQEQAGILASAAPCFLREGSRLPIISRIRLNAAQVPGLLTGGRLYNVVLHELGHALGIGTIWNQLGLLRNPSLPNQPGADTHFTGPRAIAAYDAVGGTGFTGGSKVPVENTQGGQGTRDSHWRYFALGNELMVGFIFSGATPISRITVASLADLGYEVNEGAADPYSLPAGGALAPPQEDAIPLHEDIVPGPMYLVNEAGVVVDTIPAPPGRH